jgi:hypothetical protein
MMIMVDHVINRRPVRRVVVAAGGILSIAVLALLAPSVSVGLSTPRCSVSNLRVDKVGEDDFTSHRSWDLALRNVAPTTCQLRGYPRVRLLDSRARLMPTRVDHVAGSPHTVVLRPWHRAFFTFTFATSGPCSRAVFAYGVRVIPPNASRRLAYYAGRFDLCGPPPAMVTVSPVMARRPF